MTAPLMGELSTTEAATVLGVHRKTLIEWVESGAVRAIKTPGGWLRFNRSDLEAFAAGCVLGAAATKDET